MSDDYLWDRTGAPDEDELWLERVMPALSSTGTRTLWTSPAPLLRSRAPRRLSPELAAAAALVLLIGGASTLFFFAHERPSGSVIENEREAASSAGGVVSPLPTRAVAGPTMPSHSSDPLDDLFRPDPVASAPVPRTLDPSAIQQVVARHQGEIRRVCWSSALQNRKPDAPNTVRVQAKLTISPSGAVRSALTQSAEVDSYPDLPPCMARQMRRWKFGRSLEGATVQIPFVFVVQ